MRAGLNRPGSFVRGIPAGWERARLRACRVWLILIAALLGPGLALADEPNRAGLVVQFADGQTETICVEFEGEEIAGADLLIRSGLDAVVDPSSGLGIIVCQIEGQGCDFPAEPCFCQCSGSGPCAYWNYFYREPGQDSWSYAALGALRHKARPGSVDAWVWGDGTTLPAADLAFEVVCPSPTPAATQFVTSTPQKPALQVVAATGEPTPEPTQTQPVEPPASVATPSPKGQGASAYWLFGGLVLILALAGVVVWLRTSK
jgi:hypothetical protein